MRSPAQDLPAAMRAEFQSAFDFWPLDLRRRARFGDTMPAAGRATRAEGMRLSREIDRHTASLGARIAAARAGTGASAPEAPLPDPACPDRRVREGPEAYRQDLCRQRHAWRDTGVWLHDVLCGPGERDVEESPAPDAGQSGALPAVDGQAEIPGIGPRQRDPSPLPLGWRRLHPRPLPARYRQASASGLHDPESGPAPSTR